MPGGSGGGAMPAEAWLFACGFRVVIGKLLDLELPKGDPVQPLAAADLGHCQILICEGTAITVNVDFHTAIIGLDPAGVDLNNGGRPVYHIGELVQVNLRARDRTALSIERYFSNVMHHSNTQAV